MTEHERQLLHEWWDGFWAGCVITCVAFAIMLWVAWALTTI